jgi:uncharacterized protein (DUF924 family)
MHKLVRGAQHAAELANVPYSGLVSETVPGPGDILRFWFGADLAHVPELLRKRWFAKSAAFDAEVRTRFLAIYGEAFAGNLEVWRQSPLGCLSYIILLDQFPRNMFRNTARAFASDYLALAAARGAVSDGFDRQIPPLARAFIYLPFEHSEDLADQDECAYLFGQWHDEPELLRFANFARQHRAVIARFGRFPHRNAALARESTAAELDFLSEPRSSF